MIAKSQSKYIRSLALQKFRKEHGYYVVEGEKMVAEFMTTQAPISHVVFTERFSEKYAPLLQAFDPSKVFLVNEATLQSMSSLRTATHALAVVKIPQQAEVQQVREWALALEEVRDPGNMGTILRIADWFGIRHVFASPGCADVYQPKVVQAAMGAHLRVCMQEVDLPSFLKNQLLPIYATTLQGENVFATGKRSKGIILLGNESQGLSDEVRSLSSHQLKIPGRGGAESLNASVAAGIVCAVLVEG